MFVTVKNPSDPTARAIYEYILRTFAQTGHPPSVETIVQALNLPDRATGEHYLRDIETGGGIYRDSVTGKILSAYPFSATPTPHRITLGVDQDVYAMCAIDALGMPFMLKTDAVIHSTCQQCDRALTLDITNEAISAVSPQEMVVVYVNAPANCCAATDQCPYINFFCGPEHAQTWQASQPQIISKTLMLPEALDLGRATFENLLHSVEGNIQPKVRSESP